MLLHPSTKRVRYDSCRVRAVLARPHDRYPIGADRDPFEDDDACPVLILGKPVTEIESVMPLGVVTLVIRGVSVGRV